MTDTAAATHAAVQRWVRFREGDGRVGFGTLVQDRIDVHDGDMFTAAAPSGRVVAAGSVQLLSPVQPGKVIGLWNNFGALRAKG